MRLERGLTGSGKEDTRGVLVFEALPPLRLVEMEGGRDRGAAVGTPSPLGGRSCVRVARVSESRVVSETLDELTSLLVTLLSAVLLFDGGRSFGAPCGTVPLVCLFDAEDGGRLRLWSARAACVEFCRPRVDCERCIVPSAGLFPGLTAVEKVPATGEEAMAGEFIADALVPALWKHSCQR